MELDFGTIISLLIMGGCIFAVQFALCLKAKKVITRLVPLLVLIGIEIICVIVILVAGTGSDEAMVISLTALSQMAICAVLMVPVELAWLVFGIKWFIEKKKNNPEVYGENT